MYVLCTYVCMCVCVYVYVYIYIYIYRTLMVQFNHVLANCVIQENVRLNQIYESH